MEKIVSLFEEAQLSNGCHKANSRKLHSMLEDPACNQSLLKFILQGCIDRALLCQKREPAVEKIIRFSCDFLATATPEVFGLGVIHLLKRSKATEKNVRQRACECLTKIFASLSDEEFERNIDEDLWGVIVKGLLYRLKDKIPSVRVNAIAAIRWFQQHTVNDKEDVVTAEIRRLMQSDVSRDVRAVAVETIFLCPSTIPHIIARAKDIHSHVRVATFKRLNEVMIQHVPSSLRPLLVGYGLNDRDKDVKQAALDLIFTWLHSLGDNIPKLLQLVGLRSYEGEAAALATCIIEEIEKGKNASPALKRALFEERPDWQLEITALKHSEIYWALMRCAYAVQYYSPIDKAEMTSALLPDTVVVCDMLRTVDIASLNEKPGLQLNVLYLLRMTAFIDDSDLIGGRQLEELCDSMLQEVYLPDKLVETVLMAWRSGFTLSGQKDFLCPLLGLAGKVHGLILSDEDMETAVSAAGQTGDFDSEEMGEAQFQSPEEAQSALAEELEEKNILAAIRVLEIIDWTLRQSVGVRAAGAEAEQAKTLLDAMDAFVWGSLQKPYGELRYLAVRTLGLMALYSEAYCDAIFEVLPQVSVAGAEDTEIRCYALQAVVDMALAYPEKYKEAAPLKLVLLQLVESAPPVLQRVAVEGTAKLLFAGSLVDPRLFANLLKFFFLPELTATDEDESTDGGAEEEGAMDGEAGEREQQQKVEEAYHSKTLLGSLPRLHQCLSIFFHAFLAAGRDREKLVLESISDLVAEVAMLVRGGDTDSAAVQKIASHVILMTSSMKAAPAATTEEDVAGDGAGAGAGDSSPFSSSTGGLHARLAAALAREALKLGRSRSEKSIAKEYLKVFCTQEPESWVDPDTAPIVLLLIGKMSNACEMDKTTQKAVDTFKSQCKSIMQRRSVTAEASEAPEDSSTFATRREDAKFRFLDLAPGLYELLRLEEDDDDELELEALAAGLNLSPEPSAAPASRGVGGGRGAAAAGSMLPPETPRGRSTAPRQALLAAQSRLKESAEIEQLVDSDAESEDALSFAGSDAGSDADSDDAGGADEAGRSGDERIRNLTSERDDIEDENDEVGLAVSAAAAVAAEKPKQSKAAATRRGKQSHSKMQSLSSVPLTPTVLPPANKKSKKLTIVDSDEDEEAGDDDYTMGMIDSRVDVENARQNASRPRAKGAKGKAAIASRV